MIYPKYEGPRPGTLISAWRRVGLAPLHIRPEDEYTPVIKSQPAGNSRDTRFQESATDAVTHATTPGTGGRPDRVRPHSGTLVEPGPEGRALRDADRMGGKNVYSCGGVEFAGPNRLFAA